MDSKSTAAYFYCWGHSLLEWTIFRAWNQLDFHELQRRYLLLVFCSQINIYGLTLSAGFQGGEVTPLFSIGASFGIVLASLLGLPATFVAALGYAAVFGSATNTLIAPIIIGAEIFGFEYLPYFVVACTLSHVFNGNLSIYSLQKRG